MRRLISSTALLIGGTALAATVASSTPAAATAAAAGEAAAYRTQQVTIPAGTLLRLRLNRSVGSDLSRVEDPVTATLATPVRYNGREVLAGWQHGARLCDDGRAVRKGEGPRPSWTEVQHDRDG